MSALRAPMAVAVEVSVAAGADIAVVSVQADARDPSAKRRHEFTVGPEIWKKLLGHLEAADFWNLPGDPEENERPGSHGYPLSNGRATARA